MCSFRQASAAMAGAVAGYHGRALLRQRHRPSSSWNRPTPPAFMNRFKAGDGKPHAVTGDARHHHGRAGLRRTESHRLGDSESSFARAFFVRCGDYGGRRRHPHPGQSASRRSRRSRPASPARSASGVLRQIATCARLRASSRIEIGPRFPVHRPLLQHRGRHRSRELPAISCGSASTRRETL